MPQRKPHSDILNSMHEAMADLYEIGLADAATMRKFDRLCLGSESRSLGARIRSARNAIGMSQEALGQAMGFTTRQPISRIERGERTVRPDELVQLSGILRRDIVFFIGPA